MNQKIEELFKLPEVIETFHGDEQFARDMLLVYLDTPERIVVYLTHDDEKWLWLKDTGWEPCFFTDDAQFGETIQQKYGYYELDSKFIDHEDVTQYLYRECYVSPKTGEKLHPLFVKLMDQLREIPDEEKINNPEHGHLMHRAMHYAPESFKNMMDDKLEELGLMPEATGYKEDGTPMFTIKALADKFGITEEEAIQMALEAERKTGRSFLEVDANIHKKH